MLQIELADLMGVSRSGQRSTYLGIPSTVGRSKCEIFQMLVDRVRKKAKDWKRRFLSGAGKMVLIKSVLQSIPSYLLSCFAIPDQICQRLNSVAANFFWGQKHDERRIHWKSWKKLCMAKGDGGLGFRDISLFNQAMLAKQAWRLLTNENSLIARSLKARYYPRNDLLLARNAHNPSFVWKSILVGRKLLEVGVAWKLGNGERIRIGKDPWLPKENGGFEVAKVADEAKLISVAELLEDDGSLWDLGKLEETLVGEDRWRVTAQLRGNPQENDKPFWPSGKLNNYSVKAGYKLALEIKMRMEASSSYSYGGLWNWIWKLEVIPKVKLFLWKCLAQALPTAKALRSRNIDVDIWCRRCGLHEETVEHALRDCEWVEALWSVSPLRLPPMSGDCSIIDWLEKIQSCPDHLVHAHFASLAWSIWYSRNLLIFQQKEISHMECLVIANQACWKPPLRTSTQHQQAVTVTCDREGQRKISCDVAWNGGNGIGIGVVMTTEDGGVVGCRYGFIQGNFSVLEGEAVALLEGMYLGREYGVEDVIFETDSQSLYWLLHKREDDLSYLGNTLRDINREMDSFSLAMLSWTPRDGNFVADKLASFALCNFSSLSSALVLPFDVNILYA